MVREGPFKFDPFRREEEDWNRGISEGTELDESRLTKEDCEVGSLSGDVVDNESHLPLTPTPPMLFTRQGTSWSGRGATQTHTAHPGSDPSHQPPALNTKPSPRTSSAMRRNVDAQTTNAIPPTESNIVSHTTDVDDQGEESGNKELLKKWPWVSLQHPVPLIHPLRPRIPLTISQTWLNRSSTADDIVGSQQFHLHPLSVL